ncbi:MAG TPA: MarR family transcriptional regulator [Cytophagales bacterium]|nr:MarR family transcriptional regulator [Cytophagales bacterium]HAA21851.1 MarR family transcriptional regulator [Cytophagales bacterium]HAP61197.1 MarR family transcriptional regulator [Cytophagales bacterium]
MKNSPETLWLENQICFPLYAVSRMVTKLYTPLLEKLDITYPQYLVLLVLWEKDERSVSEISELLHLETNTLTPLLKRMESKELIRRQRSKEDERRVEITLASKGRALQQEATCIPETIVNQFQDASLGLEEVLQLKQTLGTLMGVLKDSD